ncbi:hypothetical protein FJZ31_05150 [Candidatus Poribacteria bacterium]|nr:hypothetical protein [Candidatus Poribacteria bacterium]
MQQQISLKESLIKVIDDMSNDKIASILDFALSMKSRPQSEEGTSAHIVIKEGSSKKLQALVGRFGLGGDAVADAENYWE